MSHLDFEAHMFHVCWTKNSFFRRLCLKIWNHLLSGLETVEKKVATREFGWYDISRVVKMSIINFILALDYHIVICTFLWFEKSCINNKALFN